MGRGSLCMRVNVIGAGISGMMSAYFLSEKGHEVVVYDKEKYPAMQCSYANGGQISVCNSETWNNWPTVWKGIKWLTQPDAPLLIRPSLSWDKLKWMAGFLKHTTLNSHLDNTSETIRLGLKSRKLYKEIEEKHNLKYNRSDDGMLQLYTNVEDLNHAYSMCEYYKANKLSWQMITPEQLIRIEPNLKTFKNVIGAAYILDDWSGDIHKFCTQLKNVLTNQGVRFIFDQEFDIHNITDTTVLCTGHELATQAKLFGDNLNIYPVKGYSITINLNDEESRSSAPYVSLLDNNKKIVCSRFGNRLRVAGTAELDGTNLDIRKERIQPLLNWVHENFPGVNTSDYSSWACLRPMNSNMMPVIKQSKLNSKVYYNGGHGHLGWTLGAVTGKMVSELI